MIELLIEIKDIFNKLEIPFWLNYGTLLGIYRDNKMVDDDLDLATLYIDKIKENESKFNEYGFDLQFLYNGVLMTRGKEECGFQEYTIENDTIKNYTATMYTERYFAHKLFRLMRRKKAATFALHPLFRVLGGTFVTYLISKDYVLPLKEIEFEGEKFPIPNNPDEYLKYFYGNKWKTPMADYSSTVSRKNYYSYKGSWNEATVVCPRCNKLQKIDSPHVRKEIGDPFVKVYIACECGEVFKEDIFVKGTIRKRMLDGF